MGENTPKTFPVFDLDGFAKDSLPLGTYNLEFRDTERQSLEQRRAGIIDLKLSKQWQSSGVK